MGNSISELIGSGIGHKSVGDGEIQKIEINRKNSRVDLTVAFYEPVKPHEIRWFEKELAVFLDIKKAVLHPIFSAEMVNTEFCKQHFEGIAMLSPICEPLVASAEYSLSGDILAVGLTENVVDVLEQFGIARQFTRTLNEQTGKNISVEYVMIAVSEAKQPYSTDDDLPEMPEPPQEKLPVETKPEPEPIVTGEVQVLPERDMKEAEGTSRKTVWHGKRIQGEPVPITDVYIKHLKNDVVIEGIVFSTDERKLNGKETSVFTFNLTDFTSSVTCKMFLRDGKRDLTSLIVSDVRIRVCGNIKFDEYLKCEIMEPSSINVCAKTEVVDKAQEKRVELHLHTTMSAGDGITPAEKLVKRAFAWGHRAVAITDHGVLQAFPEAMNTYEDIKKKNSDADFKIIYGVEAYIYNDKVQAVFGDKDGDIKQEYVIFDLETTGLSAFSDRITEIGAVKCKEGKITEEFCTYVNPQMPIPPKITELTGITNADVADAPLEDVALMQFMNFCKDGILVAHNANFDIGFMRAAAERHQIPFENTYIDTLPVARSLLSELKQHKLNIIAAHLGLGEFNHHRASDDAKVLAAIFDKLLVMLEGRGCKLVSEISSDLAGGRDSRIPDYHCVLLVKNLVGLKNLYRLVSEAHLNHFSRKPRIPKSLLTKYREGILVGSACEAGELYSAMLAQKPMSELYSTAEFYDYLEIQPVSNNEFMITSERPEYAGVRSEQDIQELNKKVLAIGRKLSKPVVATGDVHYLDTQEMKYREIIMTAKEYDGADKQAPLYFKTTDEMLNEFAYLGEEIAHEVVVLNPNILADSIEIVRPIPKGTYSPKFEGSDKQLTEIVYCKAKEIYGDPLPQTVIDRIERELGPVIKHGYSIMFMIANKLVAYSNQNGYMVGSRGSVGSTLLAFLSGISEVNPLPPHYFCKKCMHSDFVEVEAGVVGLDLPAKVCPVCGENLQREGLDIPFETFLGFSGEKAPDIDLNFSGEFQSMAHKYTEELFGRENVFKAGTITTIAEKTTYRYLLKYCEKHGYVLPKPEMQRLASGCTGVKQTTGQHPGGMVVVPQEYSVYDFTPIQHPADKQERDVLTTHFDFHSLHDTILKLDELGHDVPTMFKYLFDLTGIPFSDVPIPDEKVMQLFTSTEPLGVTPDQINSEVGTFALPEMGTPFVRQMLVDAKPKTVADLLQISGLSHGTDVWNGNAQNLIRDGICTISQVIGTRDNIMIYLIGKGVDPSKAFKITEIVRKGGAVKNLTPDLVKLMEDNGVPQWYIDSCFKIKYMFPKAHAAAYVISALKLAWFKVYKPLAFYSVYFSVRGEDVDYDCAINGYDFTRRRMGELSEKITKKQATQKEQDIYDTMQILLEMFARGFAFLQADLYKSDARKFLLEDDKIRIPFLILKGVGPNAANDIADTVKREKIECVEDFTDKCKISSNVVSMMREAGVFGDLPESNQLTLF